MFPVVVATVAVLAIFALVPPAAGAGGILPVGVDATAVSTDGSAVEYVTLPLKRGSMVVKRERGGRVIDRLRLRERFHVPTLAYDGSTGGLSVDGRRLILIRYPARGGREWTVFAVVDAERLRLLDTIRLRGHFSFHAMSPDVRQLYLINYAPWDMAEFAVRTYDLRAGRLRPGDISEPTGGGEPMSGIPMTRTGGPGGRWQYTLYGVLQRPYLHALDTRTRRAYRTPLGQPGPRDRMWWRVRLGADGRWIRILDGGRTVARVDARTHKLITRPKPVENEGGGPFWLLVAAPTAALILLAAVGGRRVATRTAAP